MTVIWYIYIATDTTKEHVYTHTSGILRYHLHLRKMKKDGKCQTIRGTAIFRSPTRIMELNVKTPRDLMAFFKKLSSRKLNPSEHSRTRGGGKIVQLAIIKSGIGGSSSTNSRQKGEWRDG
ncbi:hypothetical protein ALC56_06968 [Trachymyrmex septentrionalis]|uniref:Uncharacterized protein n=1 Tax=Trachymyrmex septentrionalis TaxID=34720 RepID=A0A151JWC8_9HYME|nr:hypothetical protein ALC56_06968 [Trachymyrmex septentrionalis]